ncbi:MAG TPA: phosphoglycerate kinase [Candidatus Norongarragalinales archaeon]|nr:phosphoglycerate kinase [Candidatus Norongarragalinales archaeon]
MKDFLTLDDFNPEGKKVLVRVDINASIENGQVQDSERMEAHARTLEKLSDKGARVIVLAHQGRPEDSDLLPLEQHAKILGKHLRRRVKYVDDLMGSKAKNEIRKLKDGKIILLENVRFLAEEQLDGTKKPFEKTLFVQTLSKVCDVFVNDAFSAAHRAQTSLIGFSRTLPAYAGRVMENEYRAIKSASLEAKRPSIYLLGGGKPQEALDLMAHFLQQGQADKILTSGVLGELCLIAKGKRLGSKEKWLEEQKFTSFLPKVKILMEKYGDLIDVPGDFAYKDKEGFRVEVTIEEMPNLEVPVFDIGMNTAQAYAREIRQAKTVYLKGPVGAYEQNPFELGTRTILKAMTECKGFTLIGGGHTTTAMQKFGFSPKKYSHVSVAGGALLAMLCGKPLPAIDALKESARRIGYESANSAPLTSDSEASG